MTDIKPTDAVVDLGHPLKAYNSFTFYFNLPGEPEKSVTLSADDVEMVGMELPEAARSFWESLPEYNPLRARVHVLEQQVFELTATLRGLNGLFDHIQCTGEDENLQCPLVWPMEHDAWCTRCRAKDVIEAQMKLAGIDP